MKIFITMIFMSFMALPSWGAEDESNRLWQLTLNIADMLCEAHCDLLPLYNSPNAIYSEETVQANSIKKLNEASKLINENVAIPDFKRFRFQVIEVYYIYLKHYMNIKTVPANKIEEITKLRRRVVKEYEEEQFYKKGFPARSANYIKK